MPCGIVFVGQWKDFFGLRPEPSGLHFHEKIASLLQALPTIDLPTTGIAVLTLATLIAATIRPDSSRTGAPTQRMRSSFSSRSNE